MGYRNDARTGVRWWGPWTLLGVGLLLACNGAGEMNRGEAEAEAAPNPPSSVVEPPAVEVPPEPPPPPTLPDTHAVFDLVANQPLAHVELGSGLLIEAGSPGFARYSHGNAHRTWELNATYEGRPVALPRRSASTIRFPLTAAQAQSAEVIAVGLWYGSGRYRIEAELAGRELGGQDVAEGWQTVVFPVEPGLLVAGENTLELSLPSDSTVQSNRVRGALESIYVGPARDDAQAVATAPPSPHSLSLDTQRGLAWYTVLPDDPWLVGSASAVTEPSCQLALEITTETGETSAYSKALDDRFADGRFGRRLEGAPVGRVVRLSLGLDGACDGVTVDQAAIHTPGGEPPVLEVTPPVNVVLWLVDALRADRLRSIRPDTRVIGPGFDRMAAEGVVFTRAYVQGNESFASHAALFSGQYPATTGVRSSRDHLDDDPELLAEVARRAGLRTAGYSSNGHIRSSNGFEQGFDFFINALRDNYRYKAPGMLSHASNWVDEHGDEPFYLYIGTVDCHVTYRSHDDILPLYDPEPYDGPFQSYVSGEELGRIKGGSMRITDRDRVRIEAIYDDTVTFSDRHFGLFLDHLAETGHLDDTLIILTSDHGDEFWEHGSVGHGQNVYDELVHVPLLMRYPAAIPGGTVVDEGVDTVDILPTLADLLGVEPDPGAQGESLLPLIHGVGADYPRPAITQQYGHTYGMSLHRWKLVWRTRGDRALFDWWSDPTEQVDVAASHPFALRFTTDALGLFLAYEQEWSKADWGVPSNLRVGFTEDLAERATSG